MTSKEKFTSHENLRQTVEYSKSGRSSCKKCKSTIASDTIRVGIETPSRVFDGYDVKWYHLKCVDFPKIKVFYINQLKHYELLRWEDQLSIRNLLNQSDDDLDLTLATYYKEVWRIKDILIDQLKPAVIKKIFLEFYPKLDLSPSYNLHFIADGLAFGRIGPCPSCNGLTVLYDGKNYYCRGFSSSFSRCNWHGPDVKRYRFLIPDELKPKTAFFKDFEFSHIHPHQLLEYTETTTNAITNGNSINEIPTFTAFDHDESNQKGKEEPEDLINAFFYKSEPINKQSVLLKIDPSFSINKKNAEIVVQEDSIYGWSAFNVSMNLTDIINNNNSFYILQMIQTGSNSFWIFAKWGRIGTSSNGGTMEHSHSSLRAAQKEFEERFLDKTGCNWSDRGSYKKQSGKYYLVDLEDGDSNNNDGGNEDIYEQSLQVENTKPSKLSLPVQSLVSTLFDVNLMEKSLTSLQFDIQKMPLGKISQNQIAQAYKVLNTIQDLLEGIEKQTPLEPLSATQQHNIKSQLIEASCRFYTMIPHRFEGRVIPTIDNKQALVKSIKLVDALSEIEVVNNLKKLKTTASGNSIDDNYDLLKSNITALDKDSLLYRNIQEYAISTIDSGNDHDGYGEVSKINGFDILDIFKVDRQGEEQSFSKWESNTNRMLLMHGSRIQSWCSILPNGLRIASPLSPKSGFRLGKGVYLTDSSSVSLCYTGATKDSPTAVIAICDVALGNSAAVYQDIYMEQPETGYHSTKAIGKRQPCLFDQLNGCYQDKDEFIPSSILRGPIIENGGVISSFSHNEYVIYDNTQCRIKYLLKLKVNFI